MHALVSIVLPVYNGESFLRQSVESVLNQSYENLELIIVNDCSTDSTEKIVQEYLKKDARVRYVKNVQNMKLPQSLNIGFEHASGKYLTWTSDDNIFDKYAIEKMITYLEKNPAIQLVYCDYDEIDAEGVVKRHVSVKESKYLIYRNVIGACFLYRKEVVEKVGTYDTKRFLVEDYEYWLRISLVGELAPLHENLYQYRFHENSLTETKKKEIAKALKKVRLDYLKQYEKEGYSDETLFDIFHDIMSQEKNFLVRVFQKILYSIRNKSYIKYMFLLKKNSVK